MEKKAKTTITAKNSSKNKDIKTPIMQPSIAQEKGIWKNFVNCIKKYAKFSGRTSRYEYFSFLIVSFAISATLGAGTAFFSLFYTLSALFSLFILLPHISALNRRLHDIGKNLWNGFFNWVFYGCLIGIVIGAIYYFYNTASLVALKPVILWSSIAIFIASIRLLFFICRAGENKENKYGVAPTLNAPETEKTAIKMIVGYFLVILLLSVLNTFLTISEHETLNMQAKHTESQLAYIEQNIHNIYNQEKNYAWLSTEKLIQMSLAPTNMINSEYSEVVSELGLPVSAYGFDDLFILSLDNVDIEKCHIIATNQWRLYNLDEMMLRKDNITPPVQETLTDTKQCAICEDATCQIFWKIK